MLRDNGRADLVLCIDANLFLFLSIRFEFDHAVDQRKQRVILTQPDIQAGLEFCSVLANDDRTRADELTVKSFHAQSLRITIAPVAGRPATFFMCHFDTRTSEAFAGENIFRKPIPCECFALTLSRDNVLDLQARVKLAVTARDAPAMLVAIIKIGDFGALPFTDDSRNHLTGGLARLVVFAIGDEQHFRHFHFIPDLMRESLDVNLVADGHTILFSACFDDCVHDYNLHTKQKAARSSTAFTSAIIRETRGLSK